MAVASALRELGYRASYVGNRDDRAPERGSTDEAILHHARATGQVVVTSNHDMILLCLEQNQSVIWVDPYGRKIPWERMVVLVFNAAPEWDRLLRASDGPICIRSLRSRNEALTKDEAIARVVKRMRNIAARKRRTKKAKPVGPLLRSLSAESYWGRGHNRRGRTELGPGP